MIKSIAFVVVAAGLAIGGCTLTNSQDQPIVLTAQSAPDLIIAQMKKGCADLMSNPALVKFAVDTATAALKDANGVVAGISNSASIGCSLLVPPPALPAGSAS